MNKCISVKESTVRSLQIIFAYQGQQLIRHIGKKKGWDKNEINATIKEFINNNKHQEIKIVKESHNK
jgi:ADP-glucose pyrophosphorylase